MPLVQTISIDVSGGRERRAHRRETLDHRAVLLFFGQSEWGKLADLSENGMCFQFSRLPSLREHINFTLQTMGCMPVPPRGISAKPFEVQGEIVWTREFERLAGVRFIKLTEESRGQIQGWLTFETSANTCKSSQEHKEALALSPGSLAPPASLSEAPNEMADVESPLTGLEASESFAEPQPELESNFAAEIHRANLAIDYDAPADSQKERPEPEASLNRPVGRFARIAVGGCLAALAVSAAVRTISTYWGRRAEAVGRNPLQAERRGGLSGAASNSSVGNNLPFQVEVLDSSGKSWLLSFANTVGKNGNEQIAAISADSSNSHGVAKETAGQKQAVTAAKPKARGRFSLVAPKRALSVGKVTAPSTLLAEAPPLPVEFEVSSGKLIGDTLANAVTSEAANNARIGGEVKQPRLIRSVNPVYPAIARASHVSGDVVLDAMIDSDGKVATVKVISGPALLQQAAADTVSQWKYEPARLHGQPVAMHMTVTMKFRTP